MRLLTIPINASCWLTRHLVSAGRSHQPYCRDSLHCTALAATSRTGPLLATGSRYGLSEVTGRPAAHLARAAGPGRGRDWGGSDRIRLAPPPRHRPAPVLLCM